MGRHPEETITVTADADRRHAERPAAADGDGDVNAADGALYGGVMISSRLTTQAGQRAPRHPGHARDAGVRRRGRRNNEARLQVDGLNTGAAFNGGGVSSYVADIGNAQEISITTSGGMGEAEVGGPSFSIVPKTGGNTIKGTFYRFVVTSGMVGNNYTDDAEGRAA